MVGDVAPRLTPRMSVAGHIAGNTHSIPRFHSAWRNPADAARQVMGMGSVRLRVSLTREVGVEVVPRHPIHGVEIHAALELAESRQLSRPIAEDRKDAGNRRRPPCG